MHHSPSHEPPLRQAESPNLRLDSRVGVTAAATGLDQLTTPAEDEGFEDRRSNRFVPCWMRSTCFSLLARFSHRLGARWLDLTGASPGERARLVRPLMEQGKVGSADLSRFGLTPNTFAVVLTRDRGTAPVVQLQEKGQLDEGAVVRALCDHAERRGIPSLLSSLDKTTLSPAADAELLGVLIRRAPLLALQLSHVRNERFLLPNTESVAERAIDRTPIDTLKNLDRIPRLSPALCETLAQRVKEIDPQRFLTALAPLGLTGSAAADLVISMMPDQLKAILSSLTSLPIEDPDARKRVAVHALKSAPSVAFEELTVLLAWAGPLELSGAIPLDAMKPFWKRITAHRDNLGLGDSDTVRDLILAKVQSHPELLLKALPELNLSRAGWCLDVALALGRQLPASTPQIAADLQITNAEDLYLLAAPFAEHNGLACRRWLKKQGVAISDELASTLFERAAASRPWATLNELLRTSSFDPAQHEFVLLLCARENAARVCREIREWGELDQPTREKLFALCAKRSFWPTVEKAEQFSVAGRPTAVTAFLEAVGRDPVRGFAVRGALGITGTADLRLALRIAVSKNAIRSVPLLIDTRIDEGLRVDAAISAVRRNSAVLDENRAKFAKSFGSANLAQIVAAASRGDIADAIHHRRSLRPSKGQHFDAPEFSEASLVQACALENLARAVRSAAPPVRDDLKSPAFLDGIVASSILSGRWNSSLEAAKALATAGRDDGAEGQMVSALRILDGVATDLGKRELAPMQRENLDLFLRIRRANCIPTDTIQQTFDHFGPDDVPVLMSILEQAGSTAGENLFSVIMRAYPTEVDIRPTDLRVVQECISLGFRGLSPRLLLQLRPIFDRSPVEGRAKIKAFHELANRILTGRPVPKDLEDSPLFPGLVTAAFRPVGMTERDVAQLLRTVADHTNHLSRFRFPGDGYAVQLGAVAKVSLKAGQTFQMNDVELLIRNLQQDPPEGTALTPPVFVRRLLQGAFDQMSTEQIWHLCRSFARDPRIPQSLARIGRAENLNSAPPAMARTLAHLAEAYGVIAYDACLEVARATVEPDSSPDLRLRIERKTTEQVRRILRLQQDTPVETREILLAVETQLAKLFRKEHSIINRESRNLSQHVRELGDRFVLYLSKSKPAYFGRAGAGLCTAQENWSWNNPDFLQMIMVDKTRNTIVGNIQLHIFRNSAGQPSVLARLNPTATFLTTVDKNMLAGEMLRVVKLFAGENGLHPYLPEQTGWHELTNRDSFAPALKRQYGKAESLRVQITAGKVVSTVYRVA